MQRETQILASERKTVAVLERRTVGTDPAPRRVLKYQYLNLVGSSCLELDDASAVISYEEYFPYGGTSYQATSSATETSKRLRYCGLERDTENGFYYAGARYYAPWLARWINPDPAFLHDGPNLYLYVHANPITTIDTSGTVGAVLGGLTIYELAMGAAFLLAGTGVVASSQQMQKHPPRINWHPFSTGEEWTPPVAPPIPIPVPQPPRPAPPVAPPVPPVPVAPPISVPLPPVPVPVPVPAPPRPIPVPVPIPHPPGPITIPIPHPPGPISVPVPVPRAVPQTRAEPRAVPKTEDPPPPIYWYITYTKTKVENGKTLVYVGHTAGYGPDPYTALHMARPDKSHHMTKKGYGPAQLDTFLPATLPPDDYMADPSYWAMRGREQQMIDHYGGAKRDPSRSPNSVSGNSYRGVRKDNLMGPPITGPRHSHSGKPIPIPATEGERRVAQKKWQPDTLISKELDDGWTYYARLLVLPWVAFYRYRTKGNERADRRDREIAGAIYARGASEPSLAQGVETDRRAASDPAIRRPRAQAMFNDPNGYRIIDDQNVVRWATPEECKGLEPAAVWEPGAHPAHRLKDEFAGRPNRWLTQMLPPAK